MNLNELIVLHKSGRSYEELARDCGGGITSQRLQQIATTVPKAFPSADNIRGLARGLRVSESVVVLAAAESLGLDVARAVPRLVELLPASALSITDRQAAAIAEVIRSFTDQRAGGEHGNRSAPIDVVPDLVVTRPDGSMVVVEVKGGRSANPAEALEQVENTRRTLDAAVPDGYTVVLVDATVLPPVPKVDWDEFQRQLQEESDATVHQLSDRSHTVPVRRVARRTTSGPTDEK